MLRTFSRSLTILYVLTIFTTFINQVQVYCSGGVMMGHVHPARLLRGANREPDFDHPRFVPDEFLAVVESSPAPDLISGFGCRINSSFDCQPQGHIFTIVSTP